MVKKVSNLHIVSSEVLPSPETLRQKILKTEQDANFIFESRKKIEKILYGRDQRLLLVMGPCSIHHKESGLEYAKRLKKLSDRVKDQFLVVMRVYFEKPRTTVGWKGLIMDPSLDGSDQIEAGLEKARQFLLEVISLGLPTATELLDPITPQYIADLLSWVAIGARTTESQTHRQMASGLSMPLGFKNNTEGNVEAAINAIKAASKPQTFLGIDLNGRASAVTTSGNPDCHLILRGGKNGPNYQAEQIAPVVKKLSENGVEPSIMVDCSHENSGKNPDLYPVVFRNVINQWLQGNRSLKALMIESNLKKGNQNFPVPADSLQYGVSITDPCLDWEATEALIMESAQKIASFIEPS